MPNSVSVKAVAAIGLVVVFVAVAAIAAVDHEDSGPATNVAQGTPISAPPSPLTDLQQQYVRVVRAVSPQVVQVRSQAGLGSGVVFDRDGDVVTNAHVVTGSREVEVTTADGDHHAATVVGADRPQDLAVVKLANARPVPASFADSADLRVGDLVLAIGNPLGLRSSVTDGIVSSLHRTVAEGGGVTLAGTIQTSADINPGNSGGALVDLRGRVIGIPTLTATDPEFGGAQAEGIGFAIPSSTVRRIVPRLIEGE